VREGGGSKIKVVEAAKYARPVVATEHSARGLAPEFVAAMAVSDTGEGFANACLAHLHDAQGAQHAGAQLHALEQALYSREAWVSRLSAELRATTMTT